MSGNLLVISYYFPPYKRVGGRRWAKHVKYLNRLGQNTFVLAGDFPDSASSWDEDILEYQDKITRVHLTPVDKPYFQTTLPGSLADKLRWKWSYYTWQFRKKKLKGNYTDISSPNTGKFHEKARQLIREKNIGTVILSVGPFDYSAIILPLRQEFPAVKFVIDYRDKREDSYEGLTAEQIRYERAQEEAVLQAVDLVLTVNNDMSDTIRKIRPGAKVITLPHCVDNDFFDLSKQPQVPVRHSDKDRFIYGGELYNGMEREMETFTRFLSLYRKQTEKSHEAFFYVPYPAYNRILEEGGVQVAGFLKKEDYRSELQKCSFILLFRPSWSAEAFSSKFFEILCLRKPVLYFGKEGSVSEFLIRNKLGFHIREEELEAACSAIRENAVTQQIPDPGYDFSRHTFEHCTRELLEHLSHLHHERRIG